MPVNKRKESGLPVSATPRTLGRLPENESEYLARPMRNGRKLTQRELYVKQLHERGFKLLMIADLTGFHPLRIANLLGLPTENREWDKTLDEYENRKRF